MPIAKRCSRIIFLGCLVLLSSAAVLAQASDTAKTPPIDATCIDCIRVRVGLPRVVRGPGPGIPDNPLTEIQLPNGRFRSFSASSTTYASTERPLRTWVGQPFPSFHRDRAATMERAASGSITPNDQARLS